MKRLTPSCCSVVIFHNSSTNELESILELLNKQFAHVIVESRKTDVIADLKEQQKSETSSTLLLIDSESCYRRSSEDCPDLLLDVVQLLKEGFINNVVPIVCSFQDSPSFMLKCLQEGAADFLLKPLSEDVIKTLFLNATRYKIEKSQKKKSENINEMSNMYKEDKQDDKVEGHGQVWSKFKDRIKGVFHKEHWLSKWIADYYTPKPSVRRTSMASMLNDRKEFLKTQICSWNFLPLDLDNKDLIQIVFMILDQILFAFDELEPLRVPSGDLYHFIFDICNSYHSINPYHNFRHAVDVLQANYYFLCRIGAIEPMCPDVTFDEYKDLNNEMMNKSCIKDLLEPLDIFALLMASIGHDVGHPGVNNNFMVTTSTPLAILYNDKSVLESFHVMFFFHLVNEHCFSQLTNIRANPSYASFRKIVVNSILATDMSMHDDYVQKIKDQAERFRQNNVNFDDKVACEKEKILLCSALIKCADISNCARPFESAERWAKILAEEFFEQGELEKELGLSVLPINERGKIPLEDFQLGFKRFIALKLFESVSEITPYMQFTVDQINENIGLWELMKIKDKQPNHNYVTSTSNSSHNEAEGSHEQSSPEAVAADAIEKEMMAKPNDNIPPQQPLPEGKSSTRPSRSGI
ncbi:MAG: hypothetical protein EXX96DRAFT_573225 [Benjaminiella poitrasii]|nr:MAG: hypothetical protein EXX96DRAFT_573225 [Benjaminiella poitrasii]